MPKYKSIYSDTRVYPTLGLVLEPNDVVDLVLPVDAAGLELVGDEKAKSKPDTAAPAAADSEEV
jgi:hypothetical protein